MVGPGPTRGRQRLDGRDEARLSDSAPSELELMLALESDEVMQSWLGRLRSFERHGSVPASVRRPLRPATLLFLTGISLCGRLFLLRNIEGATDAGRRPHNGGKRRSAG
eukprot:COSAG01_NODE_1752_length_9323_cov_84.102016_3_plen_109_part_00